MLCRSRNYQRWWYEVAFTVGIVLSIQSRRIEAEGLKTPWKSTHVSRQRITTRESRAVIYLPEKNDRLHFAQYHRHGLHASDFYSLKKCVTKACVVVAELMDVTAIVRDEFYTCPPLLVPFFSSCTKSIFPALHFMPPSVWNTSRQFLVHKTLSTDQSSNFQSAHHCYLDSSTSFISQLPIFSARL
jgi:hypothetical protein